MCNNLSSTCWWIDDDGLVAAGNGDCYLTVAEVFERDALPLIAAAPDLLDALRETLQVVEYLAPEKFDDAAHEEAFNATLSRARAAISKAKGE